MTLCICINGQHPEINHLNHIPKYALNINNLNEIIYTTKYALPKSYIYALNIYIYEPKSNHTCILNQNFLRFYIKTYLEPR
jgi:hypothetical protein